MAELLNGYMVELLSCLFLKKKINKVIKQISNITIKQFNHAAIVVVLHAP
ncbi:hypothetical protein ACI6Q2_15255 [Chitinophagaceae bacterium LWZ2-11]